MTCHRVVGDGCIWEGISPMNSCLVSQSVFYQVLNAVILTDVGVVQRKRGEIIFHLKRRLKRLCYYN